MTAEGDPFGAFSDLLCLVYHEARYAAQRFPRDVLGGYRSDRFPPLSMTSRRAWDMMSPVRATARRSTTVQEVERTFAEWYGTGLAGLECLFSAKGWANSKGRCSVGGGKWAEICRRVTALADALKRGDEDETSEALCSVLEAEHNHYGPGGVREKLERLRRGRD